MVVSKSIAARAWKTHCYGAGLQTGKGPEWRLNTWEIAGAANTIFVPAFANKAKQVKAEWKRKATDSAKLSELADHTSTNAG